MNIKTNTKRDVFIRLARAFIDRHYDLPITIEQVSKEAALSPYHFIRVFCSVYKQTPHQYLVQRRIEKAKDLLRASDRSITEICVLVGFESPGSFSTLFRKLVGLSPRNYRKYASRTAQPDTDASYIPLCCCMLHGITDPDL